MRSIFSSLNAGPLSLVGLLGLVVSASALPDLRFQDAKSYQQFGYNQTRFQGGQLYIALTDGVFSIAGCIGNGGIAIMTPNIFCPLGTTALIVDGDFNGDGLSDSQTFWSVSNILDHEYLRPLRSDLVYMSSAPPSTLPRPLGGFLERSVQLYYNVLTGSPQYYAVSNYNLTRTFPAGMGGLNAQWADVVPGQYKFHFGIRDPFAPYPDAQDIISVTHVQTIEAWPGRGVVPQDTDWRVTEPMFWNPSEEIELDPRLFNEFVWRGFEFNATYEQDSTRFSMYDPITGLIEYPPYDAATPASSRQQELIDTPSTGIQIGPYLYSPGDRFVAQIDFRRNLATSSVASDTSRRLFEWNVFFVDTYGGYADAQIPTVFPVGTPSYEKDPDFDFDGDLFTNLEEFALQTDPANPASKPNISPVLVGIIPFQQCYLQVPKRPNVGSRLVYKIQRSADGLDPWITITPTDPVYAILTDNSTEISVLSRAPMPAGPCHLRVAVIQN